MKLDAKFCPERMDMQKLELYEKGADVLTLYDRHAPTLYRSIYRQVSQPQDAEDVLLEGFTIACKYENLVDLAPERQNAWLQSVARRRIIDRDLPDAQDGALLWNNPISTREK